MGAGFSTVTPPPSQVSATSVAQAVWSYSPRSLTEIQSLVSAIQNNNPNLLSTLSDILYVPAPYYAGQVSITQVAAFLDNLTLNYGLAAAVAAAISASPYGLWSTNFVTQVLPYLGATSIAQALASGQMDANRAQLILYWLAQNYYYNKWINIITANAPSSITFSTNLTLSTNVLIAQNITIASGVTVTCGTTTCFFVAQSFNNYGTVVAYGAPGGAAGVGGAGVGGTGGGGIVILAITSALGIVNVSGNIGGSAYASTASSYSSGGSGGTGIYIILPGITIAVGGTGGPYSGPGPGEPSGGGGGSGYDAAGGTGGVSVTITFSNGNSTLTYIMQGLSDWLLVNMGKTPSSITPLLFIYGSGGGGGGGGASGYAGGGGGGGGGGEAIIYGYVINGGTINAAGGTGGYGGIGSGGGGGGGLVFVFYGSTASSLTFNVAGGVPGGGAAYSGTTGTPGTAYIAAVTVNG